MRTTLTLDDDVATQIKRLRRNGDASLKDVINEALRVGLREMRGPRKNRKPFTTQTHSMGPPRIEIDNVAEAVAEAEGDGFR